MPASRYWGQCCALPFRGPTQIENKQVSVTEGLVVLGATMAQSENEGDVTLFFLKDFIDLKE